MPNPPITAPKAAPTIAMQVGIDTVGDPALAWVSGSGRAMDESCLTGDRCTPWIRLRRQGRVLNPEYPGSGEISYPEYPG
ncbi:MAG: hypothetical protein BroJett001_33530 [Chloroflexota bacterium]|nr:MAG: hypothetical protein BroJett001_33530 [Chloroflexota bacterium]